DNSGNESNSYFISGVKEGVESNLLNSIFHVRTNQLFKKLSKEQNYYYLSGLLSGAELKVLLQNKFSFVTLVSDDVLSELYLQALTALNIDKNLQHKKADQALLIGQSFIFQQHTSITN